MAYVDDIRTTFDAADFCQTVTAGVGEGRITSSLALRDDSAATAAANALRHFHTLATTPGAPDVIAAYVIYSPGAAELFTALRAVSTRRPLAAAALDCLIVVVRYSLDEARPLEALQAARSVVKEVVKTRAVLVYDVFVHDRTVCAKKALTLLRLVGQCHPILAKEILNRFNLASDVMAPALCSDTNHYCRVSFLDLMFVLLASGDYDVINALSTRARGVLITCVRVIAKRTIDESNAVPPDAVAARERGGSTKRAKGKLKSGKNDSKDKHIDFIAPSHIQKMELIAAINLLLAIQRHILAAPNHAMRRIAFAYPMADILASVAAADMPSLQVAPSQVTQEHTALRETASTIFIEVAKDSRISRVQQIASAVSSIAVTDAPASVAFVLRVVEQQPQICKCLLEIGPYLSITPQLSSNWFGLASIVSSCVMRLPSATSRFAEKKFFEKCLSHGGGLVQHTGLLIMHAFCKVVEMDKSAAIEPQRFLPPLKIVEDLLRSSKTADQVALKILASYQNLFSNNTDETNADLIKLSVEAAGEDIYVSDDSIRATLQTAPREALHTIRRKSYLSALIVRAAHSRDAKVASRLWKLCRGILESTELFPAGTKLEIDVYLSVLSNCTDCLESCAEGFEKVVFGAVLAPYQLFDEINGASGTVRVSLLSVAASIRLRNLRKTGGKIKLSGGENALVQVLADSLRIIRAFSSLIGCRSSESFLNKILTSSVSVEVSHSNECNYAVENAPDMLATCNAIQELFLPSIKYPRSQFLKFVQSYASLHMTMIEHQHTTEAHTDLLCAATVLWHHVHRLQLDEIISKDLDILLKIFWQSGISNGTFAMIPALPLCLFLRDSSSTNSISNMRAYVMDLKNTLKTDDFMLSVASVLPIVALGNGRVFLIEMVIEALENFKQRKTVHSELVYCLQSSLLQVAASQIHWPERLVSKSITYAVSLLEPAFSSRMDTRAVIFGISLIYTFVQHDDPEICFWAYRSLKTVADISLPLISSLPLTECVKLATILPFCPAMQTEMVLKMSCWDVNDVYSSLPQATPILSVLFRGKQYLQTKLQHGFSEPKMFTLMLEALKNRNISIYDRLSEDESRSVSEALRDIGFYALSSFWTFEWLVGKLKEYRIASSIAAAEAAWLFVQKLLSNAAEGLSTAKVSDGELLSMLDLISDWLATSQYIIGNSTNYGALEVMCDVLEAMQVRKVAVYALSRNAAGLEKSLTGFCSNAVKDIHRTAHCCSDSATVANIISEKHVTSAICLTLNCLRKVLMLDLVLDKAAQRTLVSLCKHDGGLLFSLIQCYNTCADEALFSTEGNEMASLIAQLITASAQHLPKFGLDEDVAASLHIAEGILSSDLAGYHASNQAHDIAIRTCMEKASRCLDVNSARKKYNLADRRVGLFSSSAANVIGMFDRRRLQLSCEVTLSLRLNRKNHTSLDNIRQSQKDASAYDPVFVLRTFVQACGEALQSPGTAIVDIGKVAKGGLLALTFTGLSCGETDIQILSYAAMDLFARLVGPPRSVPLGSAAALFKDRKQLSFLLTLLKNSLEIPMAPVLPLFAAWFRNALWVGLLPGHPAYKAVTYHFTRAPTMDVCDCLGVIALLSYQGSGPELKATRQLALSILREGCVSPLDALALRRRRTFEALMVLGGSTFFDDPSVRGDVLDTFASLLTRDAELSIAEDLVIRSGFVPWLLQTTAGVGESEDTLKQRLNVLTCLASALALQEYQERYAALLSSCFTGLVTAAWKTEKTRLSSSLKTKILTCAIAVGKLAPARRGLIEADISKLVDDREEWHKPSSITATDFCIVVSKQQNCSVSNALYLRLLKFGLPDMRDIARIGTCSSLSALLRPNSMEVSMVHAFVADGLLARRAQTTANHKLGPRFCILLAMAMESYPTVWLSIACITALEVCGRKSANLTDIAESLPSRAPVNMNEEYDRSFCEVVDTARPWIVEALLECASEKFQAPP